MNRPLYGRGQQAETGAAAVSFGDPVARGEGVVGDGAGTSPPSPADTAFYPDLSEDELRTERALMALVCRLRGAVL